MAELFRDLLEQVAGILVLDIVHGDAEPSESGRRFLVAADRIVLVLGQGDQRLLQQTHGFVAAVDGHAQHGQCLHAGAGLLGQLAQVVRRIEGLACRVAHLKGEGGNADGRQQALQLRRRLVHQSHAIGARRRRGLDLGQLAAQQPQALLEVRQVGDDLDPQRGLGVSHARCPSGICRRPWCRISRQRGRQRQRPAAHGRESGTPPRGSCEIARWCTRAGPARGGRAQ